MSGVLPDPVPLDVPGDPGALADLVRATAGAAHWFAVLEAGPAAVPPGWVGEDAGAAAASIANVAALAAGCAAALRTVSGRLATHREVVLDARRRAVALQAEQEEDFAAARIRIATPMDPAVLAGGQGTGGSSLDDLIATEGSRRRRHAALLDELAEDAAATARALDAAASVVGGAGVRGGAGPVVAHLAAELPGWGDLELSRRGHRLAAEMQLLMPPDERTAIARSALPYGASPAFAGAFLTGLGPDGLRELLALLGDGDFAAGGSLAGLLAAALGAAVPGGSADDPVRAVLDADLVDPGDPSPRVDLVALGMGTVLAAAGRDGGPRPATTLAWGRQIMARERVERWTRTVDRVHPLSLTVPAVDPLQRVADHLARTADPATAAALIPDRESWTALLARQWDDDGAALARLVARAGTGEAGDAVARLALETLGAGLTADGDPAGWTVRRPTADSLAPAVGAAVAVHPEVVTGPLLAAADGRLDQAADDLVRGLGYVTFDPGAAADVAGALSAWAQAQPVPEVVSLPGPATPASTLPAVAVPGAYVAVQEYGQRLAHALHGFEQQAAAELRARRWNSTVGVAAMFAKAPLLQPVGVGAALLARAFDADGTWENGPDRGLVLDREDAPHAAGGVSRDPASAEALARHARMAYDGTSRSLGSPEPPVPAEPAGWAPLLENSIPDVGARAWRVRPSPVSPGG